MLRLLKNDFHPHLLYKIFLSYTASFFFSNRCVNFYVGHRRKQLEPDHYQNLVAQVMNQKPNPEAKQVSFYYYLFRS